jgi:hypothetical protein
MSAAAVAMKTLTATAMAGAKTNNNQLNAACRRGHAAAKLLPPSCRRRCQAARHCRTATATAALPLRCRCRRRAVAVLPKVLPLTLPPCFCQAAASAVKLAAATTLPLPPPPPLLRCHRHGTLRTAATTAKLPALSPPTPIHCRTAAAPPPLLHCRRLHCHTAAVTATAMLLHCLSLPRLHCRRPAATANAVLPSTIDTYILRFSREGGAYKRYFWASASSETCAPGRSYFVYSVFLGVTLACPMHSPESLFS